MFKMKMKKVTAKSRQFFFHNLVVFKVILVLLVVMIGLSFIIHHYVSNMTASSDVQPDCHKSRMVEGVDVGDLDSDPNPRPISAYQHEVEELRRIKASVNNELRQLENRRLHLQSEISEYTNSIDGLKAEHVTLSKDISQIKLSLEQIRFEQEESKLFIPNIKAPHRIITVTDPNEEIPMPSVSQKCRMETCFDFSRCSLVSGFPLYFYSPEHYFISDNPIDSNVLSSVLEFFSENAYRTTDPSKACVFILIVADSVDGKRLQPKEMETLLLSLPYWGGDGRNHLLLNLASSPLCEDVFKHVNAGRAMLAQSMFTHSVFRPKFDLVIPPLLSHSRSEDVWRHLPLISPVRRKILLSYMGEYTPIQSSRLLNTGDSYVNNNRMLRKPLASLDSSLLSSQSFYSHIEMAIVTSLKSFQSSFQGNINISLACGQDRFVPTVPGDWALCQALDARRSTILQSTFSLIISPLNTSLESTLAFHARVFEALQYGAIPVILGTHARLPFAELLRWESAAVILPTPRVTEIPFYLQSFPDEDIAALRLQGRFFFQNYFCSIHAVLNTVLAVLRTRLQIPARPVPEEPSPSVFPESFTPLRYESPEPEPESDEVLGPTESPFPSETFRHNFSSLGLYEQFNTPGDPFSLYPFTPFEPWLPSEAKFIGSNYGFRPIGKGAGGDGKDFSIALGGNTPREQFTIVMLTYDREVVLIQALQRFKGLPFLNKVVVVWNGQDPPSADLRWPDIGVSIKVVKTKQNSLNNRFLPYQAIETEAILSIDDDAHLRHDEIVFGFRVWREERSRVVGFPGRFHAWDAKHQSWNYNSNYSCELSMVITGAAFFHKYYAYQYSYIMPKAIRDKVDEYMNCEDIAMNFLVAHITRRPPVKVTSRWTFRCPGCPSTLSSNSSHFEERHQCINFFTQVYGYMPLLYTQYRVDSVLFKTRISHDKSKCFKYI